MRWSAQLGWTYDATMDACCAGVSGSGQGHRILQADCDLPDTCPSAECAATFTAFVDDCTDMLGADELARLRGLYANCQELQSNAQLMLEDAEPAMIFHVLVFDDAAAQAQSMFGGGSAPGPGHPLDPLQPLPPPPVLPTPPDDLHDVQRLLLLAGAGLARRVHRLELRSLFLIRGVRRCRHVHVRAG